LHSFPQPADPHVQYSSKIEDVRGYHRGTLVCFIINVHDRGVVTVTSSTGDARPKVVADLISDNPYCSSDRRKDGDVPHTRNHWICYDFKASRVVPTHYAIRSPGHSHAPAHGNYIKSWLVETFVDGEHWVEIDHRENNWEFAKELTVQTFEVSVNKGCRQIRLGNIGRNHQGWSCLCIVAFEVFRYLIESVE
jgi:hypothetical protein